MEKFIIGGGLAGLIYAYYNKDFKVLADVVGGQSNAGFELGPRLIQKHPATERLLRDLGFESFVVADKYNMNEHKRPVIENTARIGYYEGGKVVEVPSDDFRLKYYIKSRCLTGDRVDIPETVMSENKNSIDYYEVSHQRLTGLLADELKRDQRIFIGRVQQVDLQEKILNFSASDTQKTVTMEFSQIVNTAPFPIFFKLCNPFAKLEGGFEFEPKYFIDADKYDFKSYLGDGQYDYIYFAEEVPWHRITVGKTNCIVECTGDQPYGEFAHIYQPYKWTSQCLKVGQIKQSYDELNIKMEGGVEPDFVRMLGRYAQWNHEIKTQQVVESSTKGLFQ